MRRRRERKVCASSTAEVSPVRRDFRTVRIWEGGGRAAVAAEERGMVWEVWRHLTLRGRRRRRGV